MQPNIFKVIGISSVLSVVVSLLLNYFSVLQCTTWFVSFGFHLLVSVLLYLLLFRKAEDQRDYTNKIMFSSMGRLLMCMISLLIYKVFDKQSFSHYAAHFLIHYILFTTFEIIFLLKFIKEKKN